MKSRLSQALNLDFRNNAGTPRHKTITLQGDARTQPRYLVMLRLCLGKPHVLPQVCDCTGGFDGPPFEIKSKVPLRTSVGKLAAVGGGHGRGGPGAKICVFLGPSPSKLPANPQTKNLQTKNFDLRGFDSSGFLILRGGIPRNLDSVILISESIRMFLENLRCSRKVCHKFDFLMFCVTG